MSEKNIDIVEKIKQFEKSAKGIKISYGGDGTVLRTVEETQGKLGIIPIRNYGLCEEHAGILDGILNADWKRELKMTRCPFIGCSAKLMDAGTFSDISFEEHGISEVAIKSADIRAALRFNVLVNGKVEMKDVIADGLVAATSYGSTGYGKSVTRCIFKGDSCIGLGFIAPTQGISNMVLQSTDKIRIEFTRKAEVAASADRHMAIGLVKPGDTVDIEMQPDAVSIFGLDVFHCQKCRANRHSIIEAGVPIEDQYTK